MFYRAITIINFKSSKINIRQKNQYSTKNQQKINKNQYYEMSLKI